MVFYLSCLFIRSIRFHFVLMSGHCFNIYRAQTQNREKMKWSKNCLNSSHYVFDFALMMSVKWPIVKLESHVTKLKCNRFHYIDSLASTNFVAVFCSKEGVQLFSARFFLFFSIDSISFARHRLRIEPHAKVQNELREKFSSFRLSFRMNCEFFMLRTCNISFVPVSNHIKNNSNQLIHPQIV